MVKRKHCEIIKIMDWEDTQFTDVERKALELVSQRILDSQQQRADKVSEFMDALEEADDATRLMAGIVIRQYLSDVDEVDLFTKRSEKFSFGGRLAIFMAPGMYMAFDEVLKTCRTSGEFIDIKQIFECAQTLGIRKSDESQSILAIDIVNFLFTQIAVRNPGSYAERVILKDFGTKSGKLSKSFNTKNIIFHETIVREYAESVLSGSIVPHNLYDAVICLAALDDWDGSLSLLSPQVRKRLV